MSRNNIYLLKQHSNVFGNERSIFAFRNILDAQVVRINYKSHMQRILSCSKTIHVFEKHNGPVLCKDLRLSCHDFENLLYESSLNSMGLEVIEKIVEKDNRILLLSEAMDPEMYREVTFIDRKLHLDDLFRQS